jgi:hypothetical protein
MFLEQSSSQLKKRDASEFIPMVARLGLKHRRRMKSGMRRLKLVQKDI